MAGRGDLTDAAWARLAPLLPANGQRGGQWAEHRAVISSWRARRHAYHGEVAGCEHV